MSLSWDSLMLAGAGLCTAWGGGCWGRIITSEVMMSHLMRSQQPDDPREDPWLNRGRNLHTPLISDFYLRWRNPSVTISDQSVRRVTTNHLCHESHAELITRDTPSLWSLIVTSLWHHGQSSHEKCSSSTSLSQPIITVTPLFWLHSTVHSHWLQFSQTLDSV